MAGLTDRPNPHDSVRFRAVLICYNRIMHRFLLLAALLLAGCGEMVPTLDQSDSIPNLSAPAPADLPTPFQPAANPEGAAVLPGDAPAQANPVLDNSGSGVPQEYAESGSLRVMLFSALDVETGEQLYLLEGTAPAGTVLSVNEQILVVDETGTFQVEVSLEDGPNLVEVVASNVAGDEVEFLLTINYNP
jgi:hypothetical protein